VRGGAVVGVCCWGCCRGLWVRTVCWQGGRHASDSHRIITLCTTSLPALPNPNQTPTLPQTNNTKPQTATQPPHPHPHPGKKPPILTHPPTHTHTPSHTHPPHPPQRLPEEPGQLVDDRVGGLWPHPERRAGQPPALLAARQHRHAEQVCHAAGGARGGRRWEARVIGGELLGWLWLGRGGV